MRFHRAIFVTAIALGLMQTGARAELADGITAIVHDSIITVYEVEVATMPVAEQLQRQYRNQPEVFSKKVYEAQKENIDQLVERQMILHDFETAGYNLPEGIID